MTGMIFGEQVSPNGHTERLKNMCNTGGCVDSRVGVLLLPNGMSHNLCELHLARVCRVLGLTRKQVMP